MSWSSRLIYAGLLLWNFTRLPRQCIQRLVDLPTDADYSGTGYIGSFTTLALLEAGYKVIIVDNLYNSSEEVINRIELISGKRPEYYNCNITDEQKLDDIFAKHSDIDSVIHFAALKVGASLQHRLMVC